MCRNVAGGNSFFSLAVDSSVSKREAKVGLVDGTATFRGQCREDAGEDRVTKGVILAFVFVCGMS